MNGLFLLSLLTHVFAHINLSNLHSLNIDECDLLPPGKYRFSWDTVHFYIGIDGSMQSEVISHLFALLHCALPKTDHSLLQPISAIDNQTFELCKNCSIFDFFLHSIDSFRVDQDSRISL
ncbi:hypothetical protein PFISCL1PPCAC_2840, partial [Pristionchus fissidentatus]